MNEISVDWETERKVLRVILTLSRAVDDGNWDTVRRCLTSDVIVDGSGVRLQGVDAVVTFMKDAVKKGDDMKFQHVVTGLLLMEPLSEDLRVLGDQIVHCYSAAGVSRLRSRSGSRVEYQLRRDHAAWRICLFSAARLWCEDKETGNLCAGSTEVTEAQHQVAVR